MKWTAFLIVLTATAATWGQTTQPTTKQAELTVFVIPLHGQIGTQIDKATVVKALNASVPFHPSFIVFDIDSHGGSAGASEEVIRAMIEWRTPVLAYTQPDK